MAGSRRKKPLSSSTAITAKSGAAAANKRPRKTLDLAWNDDEDQNIHSSSDEDDYFNDQRQRRSLNDEDSEEEEEEEEAIDVKRVRLAREYLEKVDARSNESSSSSSEEEEESDDDDDDDVLGRKLQRERLKRQGTLERALASKVLKHVTALQQAMVEARPALLDPAVRAQQWIECGHVRLLRGHDLTPTSVSLESTTGKRALSGSKDHSVILWDLEQGTPIQTLCPRWKKQQQQATKKASSGGKNSSSSSSRADGQVLTVALSDDGRFAAVGMRNGKVDIFDTSPASIMSASKSGNNTTSSSSQQSQPPALLLKTLTGHKGPVTCLAFQKQSNQLFTGSEDRCIRHYNIDEMLYLDTLYGHQFGVTAMDCHSACKPVSVGRDRTARVWKLDEDTHLIFRGGSKIQSAECVTMIKENWFVTGHQDGHLSLWMTDKKKAVASIEQAHGSSSSGCSNNNNPVVSVGCCPNSDVVASGSNDGFLRFWKVQTGQTLSERGMEPLCAIPVRGYINSIAFGPKAKFCAMAVGQEHRSGRWDRVKGAKNRIAVVNLYSAVLDKDEEEKEADDDKATSDEIEDPDVNGKRPAAREKPTAPSSSSSDEENSD